MSTFNLADMFEAAVDAFGDREYLVAAGERRTYAQMEERANRLAHFLAAEGVGARRPRGHLRPQQRRVGGDGLGRVQAAGRVDQHQLPLRQGGAPLPLHQRRPGGAGARRRVLPPGDRPAARAARPQAGHRHRRRLAAYPSARAPCPTRRPWPRARPSGTSAPGRATTTTSSTPAAPRACPRAWSGATRTSSTRSAVASTPPPTPGSRRPRRWSRRDGAASSPCCPSPP